MWSELGVVKEIEVAQHYGSNIERPAALACAQMSESLLSLEQMGMDVDAAAIAKCSRKPKKKKASAICVWKLYLLVSFRLGDLIKAS
jgi:hypothetical protein